MFYYAGLLASIVAAVLVVMHNQQQKQTQMFFVVCLGLVYAGWGIMHHKLHHSLHPRIVLEYIAVASLGIVAILFILTGAL